MSKYIKEVLKSDRHTAIPTIVSHHASGAPPCFHALLYEWCGSGRKHQTIFVLQYRPAVEKGKYAMTLQSIKVFFCVSGTIRTQRKE